jgi:tight adherence protein B
MLASLLRVGFTQRAALALWHEEVPESLRSSTSLLARRLALGVGIAGAVSDLDDGFGPDGAAIAAALALGRKGGVDVAVLLDALATNLDRRVRELSELDALTAGVKLSARLVGLLPLLLVPVVALAGAPLFDAAGLVLLGVGTALDLVGVAWIESLAPAPSDHDDPVAVLADALSSALSAGAPLGAALTSITREAPPPLSVPLRRARSLASLGCGWPAALERSAHPSLAALGRTLRRAHDRGLPAGDALVAFGSMLRHAHALALQRAGRRAPVAMIVPLALLVLPAYVLLGLVPFLRALSGGA